MTSPSLPPHDARAWTTLDGYRVAAPAELAQFARQEAGVKAPLFQMFDVAKAFGTRIIARRVLGKPAKLDLLNGEPVIVVRTSNRKLKRFAAAHELGHFLLALQEGLPLRDQTDSRAIEGYCNAFASHLLLPRPWLVKRYGDCEASLANTRTVATDADCTIASAAAALNDGIGHWNVTLLIWRWNHGSRQWCAPSAIFPRHGSVHIEPAEDTRDCLGAARQAVIRNIELPIIANGVRVSVPWALLRDGTTILSFTTEKLLVDAY